MVEDEVRLENGKCQGLATKVGETALRADSPQEDWSDGVIVLITLALVGLMISVL